jgi:hypothetical protein
VAVSTAPIYPEDQEILDSARALCLQLGIRGILTRVSWVEKVGGRHLWPDYVFIAGGNVKLSNAMRGKLSPDEWRPLIATGLVFFGLLNRRLRKARLASYLPVLLVYPALLLGFVVGSSYFQIVGVAVVSLILAQIGLLRFVKRLWLTSDQHAGAVIGIEQLVNSLRKVQSLQAKPKDRPGLTRPSIEERVQSLHMISNESKTLKKSERGTLPRLKSFAREKIDRFN